MTKFNFFLILLLTSEFLLKIFCHLFLPFPKNSRKIVDKISFKKICFWKKNIFNILSHIFLLFLEKDGNFFCCSWKNSGIFFLSCTPAPSYIMAYTRIFFSSRENSPPPLPPKSIRKIFRGWGGRFNAILVDRFPLYQND